MNFLLDLLFATLQDSLSGILLGIFNLPLAVLTEFLLSVFLPNR